MKKRVREPVLVTLGVCTNGQRMVLDLRLAGGEGEQAWLVVCVKFSKRDHGYAGAVKLRARSGAL